MTYVPSVVVHFFELTNAEMSEHASAQHVTALPWNCGIKLFTGISHSQGKERFLHTHKKRKSKNSESSHVSLTKPGTTSHLGKGNKVE